ncbi:oxygen-independent coproporphyrinogen III oxidase [Candidatus Vecturithrix granuli]|uniref:Oxygen-independent coproporphyrinogen III oxidase n=1 Tax=Vecturithrix granuli TaxID=1499967 RepID=A0A081C2V7_VECG1|nr:oxygen-independent coproporphyrinogen III oxidase [Candidatus Vecturithrix granuli]
MNIATSHIHATLPVFRLEGESWDVLYTPPGHLAVVESAVADEIAAAWSRDALPDETTAQEVSAWLRTRAEQAAEKWRQWVASPFTPECLTLYLSNQCQLACSYCYTAPERHPAEQTSAVMQEEAALAAARLVARHCADHNKPFYLVLHGGGEPTLHWELVERLEAATRRIAHQFGIEWRGHLATNGILSAQQAQWAARHFTSIGLSCDGPPDIQNQQRPFQGGKETAPIVERTARVIRAAGGSFEVRTTITPQTVQRQLEIVKYLHEQLGAETIRFEPVYQVRGQGQTRFTPDDASAFVEGFLDAQKEAEAREVTLSFSGVRLQELHGPYCDVLRNVLHLNPDGTAAACFFSVTGQNPSEACFVIGAFDAKTGEFEVNQERIDAHRLKVLEISKQCFGCLNIYHCTRGCPEFCNGSHTFPFATFRCQGHQKLAQTWVLKAAERIIADQQEYSSRSNIMLNYLHDAPKSVDSDVILRQWEAIRTTYRIGNRRMPFPIWAERGFEHHGTEAWQQVVQYISQNPNQDPMSIYIHVPFCDRRCKFCDCYSLPLGSRNRQEKEEEYTHTLLTEMEAWSHLPLLGHRPVTTVHFGGGTPNCLRPDVFERIIHHCRRCFHITPATEWALESTSSLLSDEHLAQLKAWGFTRLHIGVQTLEEPLRHIIGRREKAEAVIEKISRSLAMGFITSVDVIYGLPGQALSGLMDTLERLHAAGMHGVSLYRLNVSSRNRKFLEQQKDFTRDAVYDYALFQAAHQFLIQAGYAKNHFTHFARAEDRNLYYNHARRDEDLLALGPTADGVFGAYHYRHPEYQPYTSGSSPEIPVLEGGLSETSLERSLHPVITALMTASLSQAMIEEFQLERLLEKWLKTAFLEKFNHAYMLTANGAWFLNDMLTELKRQ